MVLGHFFDQDLFGRSLWVVFLRECRFELVEFLSALKIEQDEGVARQAMAEIVHFRSFLAGVGLGAGGVLSILLIRCDLCWCRHGDSEKSFRVKSKTPEEHNGFIRRSE
jgi:hypothetical protein